MNMDNLGHPSAQGGQGWSRYEELILYRLDRLDEKVDALAALVTTLQTSDAVLKFKVGLFGLVAGSVGSFIMTWLQVKLS